MGFSIDLSSILEPKKRLLMGILFIVFGVIAVWGKDGNSGVTREDCIRVEAVFKDCRYYASGGDGIDTNDIYLVFEDYNSNLYLHSSCANDRLTQRLFDLKAGAKMRLLVNERTNTVYELEVEGDTWLDFDTAKEKIENNLNILGHVGKVLFVAGIICFITALFSLIRDVLKRNKNSEFQ